MSEFAEPTNWNIRPRHPSRPPKRHYKTFIRPKEVEEAPPQPEWMRAEIPPAIAAMTHRELVIKTFVLGMGLLCIWGVHEPAQLERLAQALGAARE